MIASSVFGCDISILVVLRAVIYHPKKRGACAREGVSNGIASFKLGAVGLLGPSAPPLKWSVWLACSVEFDRAKQQGGGEGRIQGQGFMGTKEL